MTLDEFVTLIETVYNEQGSELAIMAKDSESCYQLISGIAVSKMPDGTKVIKILS